MQKALTQIKFENSQFPGSSFDLVKLEAVLTEQYDSHDPTQHHLLDFYAILVITAGKGSHTVDFTDHELDAGRVLCIRKGQVHRFQKNNPLRGHILLFKEEFLQSYLSRSQVLRSLQVFNELTGSQLVPFDKPAFEELSNLVERMAREYFGPQDVFNLGMIRSELHILIMMLLRKRELSATSPTQRRYLSHFLKLQEHVENGVQQSLRVQDYADALATSSKTLNTITRSMLGKTAKEYIDEVAILRIKRMLINTELSIKEIAHSSGFEESTNFFKYFKRLTGSTPEEFRSSYL